DHERFPSNVYLLDLALTRRANVETAAAAADPARFVASGKGPHKRERQTRRQLIGEWSHQNGSVTLRSIQMCRKRTHAPSQTEFLFDQLVVAGRVPSQSATVAL
ncbi:MAG TPA: hypothetical protein VFC32_03795, partial [Pseudolabrys sp.]|nr:hypothetical protein [Pseudolabrys sp.]